MQDLSREQYEQFVGADFPITHDQFIAMVNKKRAEEQAELQKQQASRYGGGRSYSYGRSSGGGSATYDWRDEMSMDIQGAVSDWYSRERDRMASGETPGWESEDIYIPMLQSKYGHMTGMTPEKVARMFYSARRPYESSIRR